MDSENKEQNLFQPDAQGVIGSAADPAEASQPPQAAVATLVGRVVPADNGEHRVVYETKPLTAEQLGFLELGRPAVPAVIDPASLRELGK